MGNGQVSNKYVKYFSIFENNFTLADKSIRVIKKMMPSDQSTFYINNKDAIEI